MSAATVRPAPSPSPAPAAAAPPAGAAAASRGVNPWVVAIAVVVPTFMEVLDTTIANVALRYIAGGLSSAVSDSEWVLTSYLAANAIILPISGWISARLGRRNYFLLSIFLFTLSSGLCGIAGSLGQLIFFRVVQGLAGGGLQPSSQAVLLDSFPPQKQGAAMTLFAMAALIAPVIGPTLGGYITDHYSWRWIFLLNVPVGAVALGACALLLRDPPALVRQRAELRRGPLNFDVIGLGLLSVTMVCWEVLLSKGQEWDWLGDPFGRIQTLMVLFVGGLGALVWRELRTPHPVVNLRPLANRNFAVSCVIIACAYAVLYGASTTLPGLLQSLFGYDATSSGLVMSPAGIFSVVLLPVVGALLGRGLDARWLIALGMVTMGIGNYWMAHYTLEVSPGQVVWPRVVVILGLSMSFAPLNVAAYMYLPPALRPAAVGLFSLLRNEGGSAGTSLAQAFQERRAQFHLLRLGEFLDPFNPAVGQFTADVQGAYVQDNGDAAGSRLMAVQNLDNLRQQQAAALSYFDCFWLFGILGFCLALLVFAMRRSAAEKGAHISAE